MCNKCSCTPCCCSVPYQLPGPMGPMGPPGPQGNPGPPASTVFGQAYSNMDQVMNPAVPPFTVSWDGIQNATGVTLPTSTTVRVSTAGKYRFQWQLALKKNQS